MSQADLVPARGATRPERVRVTERPLPVAHSYPEWLPQTQTWLHAQVRHTPAALVENHIVCERTTNLDQFSVPNLHALSNAPRPVQLWDRGLRKIGARRHLGFLVRTARRHDIRLVHSHFGDVAWADLGAVRRLSARHVVTFYGFDVKKLPASDPRWRTRYRELFARVDRVLCEGTHMANAIIALGCAAPKVRVQHLGVDPQSIRFAPRTWDGSTPLRVLIAASFREKKGVPDALRAVAALRADVPVEVTIIGDAGPDAASQGEKQRILSTVAEAKLAPVTRFLGYQPHRVLLEQAYGHHVFLSPSFTARDGDSEGGAPVTLLDMAATGMPIVSTTHCDIPEVVLHGRTGLLARERDVDALASHLYWLASHPGEWDALTRAGRQHVEREYDVHIQGERLAAHYHELLP